MTTTRLAPLALAAALALGVSSSAAVIDDFNTPGLSEYAFSKVLDQGTATNIMFSDAAGTIDVTSAGADGAEQVLLLRNDYSLGQGEELQLDVPSTFNDRDFGPAIGATHADLGDGTAGDNRNTADYVFITWRTTTFLNNRGFIGNSEITLGQNSTGPADVLFIARTATDDIELGWYEGATRNVARTVTPVSLSIFDNVGLYADIRVDGNGFAGADNLRIIPEPTSALLLVLSVCGFVARRK